MGHGRPEIVVLLEQTGLVHPLGAAACSVRGRGLDELVDGARHGCGFDAHAQKGAARDNEHFGLLTMRERAEHVGGGLRIESVRGTGTTVHAVAGLTSEWQ